MKVDTTRYRLTIAERREQLGPEARYAHANKLDVYREAKVKVSIKDLEELLEAYDRLQGLLK